MKKDVVAGLGEIGNPLLKTLSKNALVIGYDKDAEIAYKAFESGKTVREITTEEKILNKEQLDKLLDPEMMTKPSK